MPQANNVFYTSALTLGSLSLHEGGERGKVEGEAGGERRSGNGKGSFLNFQVESVLYI